MDTRVYYKKICSAKDLSNELKSKFDWFTGVPDSMYRNIWSDIEDAFHYAARENHAFAMAFGAKVGGKNPCVLIQNSGLGLSIDAIYGLFSLYKVGIVVLVTMRGELDWEEIQHKEWGTNTLDILKTIDCDIYDFEELGLSSIKEASINAMNHHRLSVVLLHRGNIDE